MSHLVRGSVAQVARRDNMSVARAFLECDYIILVDVSGSMMTTDSTGGRSRYDVALHELEKLQGDLPGKLAIFAYSTGIKFCPDGIPEMMGRDTDMLGALQYVFKADGTIKGFVLLSDGYPDPGTDHEIIRLAETFQTKIDTIFCGPPEDSDGRKFLEMLAKAGRGKSAFSANASNLGGATKLLLERG